MAVRGRASVPASATSDEIVALVKQRVKELGRAIVARRKAHRDPDEGRPGDPDLPDSLLSGIFATLAGASADESGEGRMHACSVSRMSRAAFQRAVRGALGVDLSWSQFNALMQAVDANNDGYVQEAEFVDAFGARLAQTGWCHVLGAADGRWRRRWCALKGATFLAFKRPQPLLRGDDFTEGPTLINRASQQPTLEVDVNGASVRFATSGAKRLSLGVHKNGAPLVFVHARARQDAEAWRDALESAAAERGEWIQELYEKVCRAINARKLTIGALFDAHATPGGVLSLRAFLALMTDLSDDYSLGLSRKQMYTLMQQADGQFSRSVDLRYFTKFFETIYRQRRAVLLERVEHVLIRHGASSVEALRAMADEAAVGYLREQLLQVEQLQDEVALLDAYIAEHFPDDEAAPTQEEEQEAPHLPGAHTAMFRRAGLPPQTVKASHIASKCESPRLVVPEPPPNNIDEAAQAEAEWYVGCSAEQLVSRRHDTEPCEHCGAFLFVAGAQRFDCDSSVFAWELYAEAPGELRLVVLRPAPQTQGYFRVVGENVVDVPERGPHTFSIPLDQQLLVNRGDVIGWLQSAGKRVLRHDHAVDNGSNVIWWGHTEQFRPLAGRALVMASHEPRTYSLRALCKPNLRRVPDSAAPEQLVRMVWGAVLDAASYAPDGSLAAVLERFNALNINSDGVVTRGKFEEGLRRVLGLSMSWIQMDLLLRHVGGNGSRIPLQRFLWLMAPPAYEREASVRAFSALAHTPGQKSTAAAPMESTAWEPAKTTTTTTASPQRAARPPSPRPMSARVSPRARRGGARPQSAPAARMVLSKTADGQIALMPTATRVGGGFEWEPAAHQEPLTWDQNDCGPWTDGQQFERWYSPGAGRRLLRRFKVEYQLARHTGDREEDRELAVPERFNAAPEPGRLPPCALDDHQNPVQPWYNLGREGAFAGFVLGIGAFTDPADLSLAEDGINLALRSAIVPALERLGFTVRVFLDEREFSVDLEAMELDVAWVLSASAFGWRSRRPSLREAATAHRERTMLTTACRKFVESGRGLAVFAAPGALVHATAINEVVANLRMSPGATPGGSSVTVPLLPHPECQHPVLFGLHTLFEGAQLCYPDSVGSLSVLYAQHNKPLVLTGEPTPSGRLPRGHGRVLVDGGLERLLCHWTAAGVERFAVNVAVWLTGLEIGGSVATAAPKVRELRRSDQAIRREIARRQREAQRAAAAAAAATGGHASSTGTGRSSAQSRR